MGVKMKQSKGKSDDKQQRETQYGGSSLPTIPFHSLLRPITSHDALMSPVGGFGRLTQYLLT